MNESINHNQSMNQSINQSMNQSINESVNQSITINPYIFLVTPGSHLPAPVYRTLVSTYQCC